MPPIAPTAPQQLEKEIQGTLDLVDLVRQRTRRDEVPAWIWLRAARGCWLLGNLDWATDFYRRAALGLTEYALDVGRRTGTVEQYAHVALGAAWMSQDKEALAECGRQLDDGAEQILGSLELPPDPLMRVGLLVTRLRISWYRDQSLLVREFDAEVERRAAGLDAWSKAAWQSERGTLSHAAIKAMADLRSPPSRIQTYASSLQSRSGLAMKALKALDVWLYERRARPPTVSDLVDEEVLSFVAAYRAQGLQPPVIRTPIEPGKLGR